MGEGIGIEIPVLSIVLLIIAFWGEPDLVDALIVYFTGRGCGY